MAAKANRKSPRKQEFKTGEFIVYPSHGVGQITAVEVEEIAGETLKLMVINFEQEKMKLRVPVQKISTVGMRKISDNGLIGKSLETLQGRARVKRTMWSRRAQEYESKINSGDLIAVAEVVRDLFRADNQSEQSYSERQIYESALDRMAREVAAARNVSNELAVDEIVLNLNARRRTKAKETVTPVNDSLVESEQVKAA